MSRTRIAPEAETTSDWSANHNPAANTKATCTRAAGGAGVSNVCTGFTVMLVAGASAPTATTVTVALIDGDTGGTTYLWGPHVIGVAAVAGATNGIARQNLWRKGSANTKMTLEFSAAAGSNTLETVSMEGTLELT